jgi:haloalkane dehalogenase
MGETGPHTERAARGVPRWSLVLGILAFVALAPLSEAQGPAEGASEAVACEAEAQVRTTEQGVAFVRTPDACFGGLPDWPYPAHDVEIDGLRQAYVDVGPADGEVVLLLHGQASWSYLYRHMIPVLADAGYRVIAMDHLGMGRSDKPIDIDAYSYLGHHERLERFVDELELSDIHLFAHEWGSIIGLRVAGLRPDLFASITVADGALPVIPRLVRPVRPVRNPDVATDLPSPFANIPDQQLPVYDGCTLVQPAGRDVDALLAYAMTSTSFRPSEMVEALTWFDLPVEAEAAYDAPYPSRIYMTGPRVFASLINDVPGTTRAAWDGLTSFQRPFLTIWSSNNPAPLGSCEAQQSFIDDVPGAVGQPHTRLDEASLFLPDDQGEEVARRLVAFYANVATGAD